MKLIETKLQLAVADGADWMKELKDALDGCKGILAFEKNDAEAAKTENPPVRHKRKYTRRKPLENHFVAQKQGTTVVKDNGDGTKTYTRK